MWLQGIYRRPRRSFRKMSGFLHGWPEESNDRLAQLRHPGEGRDPNQLAANESKTGLGPGLGWDDDLNSRESYPQGPPPINPTKRFSPTRNPVIWAACPSSIAIRSSAARSISSNTAGWT